MSVLVLLSAANQLACSSVEVRPGVVYDARIGSAGVMDVHLPGDGKSGRPAVLLVHGGGWRIGSREQYTAAADRLARSGYVAATIEYRLVPDAIWPAQIQDCFCALAHLRAHADDYGLDPTRVAVMGYSAGGHLVDLLGLAAGVAELQDPDCPSGTTGPADAVIAGAGPTDLRVEPIASADAVVELMGGPLAAMPERYAQASPVTHVAAGAPPFLLIHAEGDWFVDVGQSQQLRDLLVGAGADATIFRLPGGGHLFNEGPDLGHEQLVVSTDTPEAWLVIGDFLARTVGVP